MCVFTIYSFDLPDDVFKQGELKPIRPKKKSVKKESPQNVTSAKRKVSAENEVRVDQDVIRHPSLKDISAALCALDTNCCDRRV